MIEFALLFGLGFLSAALLAMLLAPAVHRRIVLFTENRLKATMPLSPQEIRAQKDMARAAYAAENAKTTQALVREREKSLGLQLKNETLATEASRLLGESQDLLATIEDMKVEAGNLRSRVRQEDNELTYLRESLKRTEEASAAKDLEIEQMLKRIERLGVEIDNLRLENAAGDAEIENLKSRIQALRDDREDSRREGKLALQRAKDAEQRLAQEEHTRIRLDDRLARIMADNADKDLQIERKTNEILRLKEKLKASNASGRAASRALRAANLPVPQDYLPEIADEPMEEKVAAPQAPPTEEITRLADELRHRQTALTERLIKAKTPANDEALREEIADIAAHMIVLTALGEGKSSPVRDILASKSVKGAGKRATLAERARQIKPALFEQAGHATNGE